MANLYKRREGVTDTEVGREGVRGEMEAETGVRQPEPRNANGCRRPSESPGTEPLSKPPERAHPAGNVSGLLVLQSGKEIISVVLSH